MRRFIMTAALCCLGATSQAQVVAGTDIAAQRATSQRALPEALSLLQAVVTPQNAARMGFRSAGAAASVRATDPLVDFAIPLEALQGYGGGDPLGLLAATGLIVYPLQTDAGGYTAAKLTQRNNEWTVAGVGAPGLTSATVRVRDRLAQENGVAPGTVFQVRVPALKLHFVGLLRGGDLILASVFDVSAYGLAAGHSYAAPGVLSGLVPAARAHSGDPG